MHGKAGSGKSTLCTFVLEHPVTAQLLENWADNKKLYFASYFFWKPGSKLQKSITGFFRSPLYQLAHQSDGLADSICDLLCATNNGIPAWNDHALKSALCETLSNDDNCYFILIDGLDEYTGDASMLLGFCGRLGRLTNVKLCISSRTREPFQRAFATNPQLRLHDLNYTDIKDYVSAALGCHTPMHDFVDSIARHVDGIFLWSKPVSHTLQSKSSKISPSSLCSFETRVKWLCSIDFSTWFVLTQEHTLLP